MSLFQHETSDDAEAYNTVTTAAHIPPSHDLIAAAASYKASEEYDKHCEQNGNPQSLADANDILVGFTDEFIDHIFETKGWDARTQEKAKGAAHKKNEKKLEQYGGY